MTQSTLRSGHTPTPYPHLCKLTPKTLPRNLLPIFLKLASTRPINSSILKKLPRNLLPIFLNLASTHSISSSILKILPRNLLPILLNIASTARKHSLKESK